MHTNSIVKPLACVVLQRGAEWKQSMAGPYSICLLSTVEKLFEKFLFFSLDQSPCWVFLLLNREDDLRFNPRAVTLRGASCSCSWSLINDIRTCPMAHWSFHPSGFDVKLGHGFSRKNFLRFSLSLSYRDSLSVEFSGNSQLIIQNIVKSCPNQ